METNQIDTSNYRANKEGNAKKSKARSREHTPEEALDALGQPSTPASIRANAKKAARTSALFERSGALDVFSSPVQSSPARSSFSTPTTKKGRVVITKKSKFFR